MTFKRTNMQIGSAVATLPNSFCLSKTERHESSFEATEVLRLKRSASGLKLYIGPDPAREPYGIAMGGRSMDLSLDEARLLIREIERVAASGPPSDSPA